MRPGGNLCIKRIELVITVLNLMVGTSFTVCFRKGNSMFHRYFVLAALCMIPACTLWGQTTTGTVSGTVRDTSGAVMPGVTIAVRNTDTGIGRSVPTDSRGYYSATNLSLGQYEV